MTKQQKTALNMAKFIQNQSLLLLEKLNELDFDVEADLCEKLHDDAEHLFRTLTSRLDELQDGENTENGIYGHSRFCNTDFDDKLACLNLSGV